jgi:aminoglycoside 6'-N-acetyltransferase
MITSASITGSWRDGRLLRGRLHARHELDDAFGIQRERGFELIEGPNDRGLAPAGTHRFGNHVAVEPLDRPAVGLGHEDEAELVIWLTAHLEQVLQEPEMPDGSELDPELFPELAANGFLTVLAELDSSAEWAEVRRSVIWVDHPGQQESLAILHEREGTRADDAWDPHIGQTTRGRLHSNLELAPRSEDGRPPTTTRPRRRTVERRPVACSWPASRLNLHRERCIGLDGVQSLRQNSTCERHVAFAEVSSEARAVGGGSIMGNEARAPSVPVRGETTAVRRASAADADRLVAWHADPEVARYWDDETFTRDEMLERLDRPDVDAYIIEHQGEPIGYLQAWFEDATPDQAGLDMFLVPSARGNGFGPDAARALARWLLGPGGLRRVIVDPYTWNERAVQAWTKAGFEAVEERPPHGEHRDPWVLMAIS